MNSLAYENQVLVALAQEHEEARRPVAMMIVMAAANASTAAQQEKVLLALATLRRQGHVAQHDAHWEVTADGHSAARQLMVDKVKAVAPATPEPMESGFKPRQVRDTLRQTVGGAPRPVTRPKSVPAQPTDKDSLTADKPAPASVSETPTSVNEAPANDHAGAGRGMLPADLLERCAVMHLALLAQSREALDADQPGAEQELAWLLETGKQLLAAGGRAL